MFVLRVYPSDFCALLSVFKFELFSFGRALSFSVSFSRYESVLPVLAQETKKAIPVTLHSLQKAVAAVLKGFVSPKDISA